MSLWCGKRCRQNVRRAAYPSSLKIDVSDLGMYETALVMRYVDRLRTGQGAYGLLSLEKKSWAKEALEESLDLQVYSDMLLIRLELNGGK